VSNASINQASSKMKNEGIDWGSIRPSKAARKEIDLSGESRFGGEG